MSHEQDSINVLRLNIDMIELGTSLLVRGRLPHSIQHTICSVQTLDMDKMKEDPTSPGQPSPAHIGSVIGFDSNFV